MGLYDSIKAIVLDVINSLQTLKLDEIRSVGKQPLRMIHESGAELELRQDGKAYYNDTEIGAGSGGDFYADGSVPMTGNLAMGANIITGLGAHAANGNAVRYEHLAADEHTQYLLANGTRVMTGDLTVHKSNPNLSLYPTDTNSPRVAFRNSANALKGSMYQNADDTCVVSEDGILYLATKATTGGNIKLESKAVTQLEISNTEITASVPLAMGGNKISGLATPSINGDAIRYEHLAAYEHDQYLRKNGSQYMTGDLYINKTTPHLVLQESGTLRGSLYIESDDSTVLDAATDDLTLASASNNINIFPAGTVQAKFTPTEFISYQDVVCDKTTLPAFVLYEGADYRGGIYTNSDDDTIVDCEHGDVILGTYATTGGLIKFNPLNAGNAFTISSTALTSTVALAMGGQAITNAAIAGTNSATFKINQDNAGAEASAIEFDRGSVATAARIAWSETNDRFSIEAVTGSTLAEVRTKQLDVQDQINLDDTTGTVMIKKNDSTGDMEFTVAAGDSFVFKTV